MPNPAPTRKDFLHASARALGGAWLAAHLAPIREAAAEAAEARRSQQPYRVLTPEEARELEAVAEQILPATDTPGAADAGVIHFIDAALDSFAGEMAPVLRDGLERLERWVAERHPPGTRFSDLDFDAQTRILRDLEDTPFFESARHLTVAGMFSLPSRGGNRDEVGWRLLGFDDRPVWEPPFGHYDGRRADAGDDGVGGTNDS